MSGPEASGSRRHLGLIRAWHQSRSGLDRSRWPRRLGLLLVFLVPVLFWASTWEDAPWANAPVVVRGGGNSGLQPACIPCPSPPGGCFNSVSACLGVDPSASPSSGNPPLKVQFGETLYNGLGGYTYSWKFGDGGTATTSAPSHTYTSGGNYVASLTVTESGGYKSTGSIGVSVTCPATVLDDYVQIAGTNNGIYGATVTDGMGGTYLTGTDGYFTFTLGCNAPSSSTFTASAPGYVTESQSESWTVGTTNHLAQVYLPIWQTNAPESQTEWYNVTNCIATGCASLSPTSYSNLNVNSVSVTTATACSSCSIPAAPSGDSSVLLFKGDDTSAIATAGHPQPGYVDEEIMTVPTSGGFPLSSPMVLAFNIYVESGTCQACAYPFDTSNFSVDLLFTDGTVLSTLLDYTGNPILDGNGTQILHDYWELPVGKWVRMVFDLSEVRDKSVQAVMLDYNNQGSGSCGGGFTGCSGDFAVAFDNIRLEMPQYSSTIINGGFELPQLYGWSLAGTLAPQLSTSVVNNGTQSLFLGSTTCPTTVGSHGTCSTYYSLLIQPFRIPNTDTGMNIGFYAQLGNNGGGGDFQRIWLNDRTTLSSVYLLGSASSGALSTSGTWSWYSTSVTDLEGHDVWLEIEVDHSDAAHQGDWMYLDNIYLTPTDTWLSESKSSASSSSSSASATYSGVLNLGPSVYLPSSSYEQNIPLGIGVGLQNDPGCVGGGGCTGFDSASLGIDFSSEEPSWNHCPSPCGSSNQVTLDISPFASTSVLFSTNQGPSPGGISQITMSVTMTDQGSTTGSNVAAGGSEYEENLLQGYPVSQTKPPSPWDVVIGGIMVALPFLLPGVGELADLGVVGLAAIDGTSELGLHALQWGLDSTPVTTSVSGVGASCSSNSCQFSWAATSNQPTEGGGTGLVTLSTGISGGGSWLIQVTTTATFQWGGSTYDQLTSTYNLTINV
jgi:PKD repeat protein